MSPEPDPPLFARRLLAWYRRHHRKLPWREGRDPYRIWVSEVMLQQTTVRAVIPYYAKWLKAFPDLKSLARSPLRRVLRLWQGLGYYRRARNLHAAARIMLERHGGRIPDDEAALRRLPGFGPYTTAAVLSLAFGRPRPVIDANVRRVMMRIVGREGPAESAADRALVDHLQSFFPARSPGTFNQAMMELGALVCRGRNPMCLLCPVLDFCRAAREGKQEIIPRPKKRNYRNVEAVVAVISRDGRYLIQKRPPGGLFPDLWEFPGGKVERGERPEEALRREVREETGAEIRDLRFLTRVHHAYTQFRVSLRVYSCTMGRVPALPKASFRWVTPASLGRYPLPSGSVKIVRFLARLR